MNTLTWGKIKDMMQDENISDDTPVFISVMDKEESDDEGETFTVEALDTISFPCGGGTVEFMSRGELDVEDEAALS